MSAAAAPGDVALDVQGLAPGVWRVTERRPGAPAVAGIVEIGGRTLVFDTLESAAAGARLRELAEAVAPVELVVNSHCHRDHVSGNAAFSDRPIVASPATRARAGSTPPTITLEGTLALHGGGRTVELIPVGPAHTSGDVVAFVRDCGVLFAADLAVDSIHPRVRDGDLRAWCAALDRLAELRPALVVRGHGAVGGGEALATVRDYLERLLAGRASPLPGRSDPEIHELNCRIAHSLAAT
ncbi:MAG TPA: MBL fold metallo-hydrolase [Gaiellaceae bacterium]